jgi:hypothetical protein
MILTRINPITKQVTMLSIPRDLYVPLSSGGTDKIDKAYLYGQANAAVTTVENDFGVHIDHYTSICRRSSTCVPATAICAATSAARSDSNRCSSPSEPRPSCSASATWPGCEIEADGIGLEVRLKMAIR